MEIWLFILILILILIPLFFSIKSLIKNYKLAFVNPIENITKSAITWFVINILLSLILLGMILFIIGYKYLASGVIC